jgi:hypothetical protein
VSETTTELRDRFAIAALPAIIQATSTPEWNRVDDPHGDGSILEPGYCLTSFYDAAFSGFCADVDGFAKGEGYTYGNLVAAMAYNIADAMLLIRNRPAEQPEDAARTGKELSK